MSDGPRWDKGFIYKLVLVAVLKFGLIPAIWSLWADYYMTILGTLSHHQLISPSLYL